MVRTLTVCGLAGSPNAGDGKPDVPFSDASVGIHDTAPLRDAYLDPRPAMAVRTSVERIVARVGAPPVRVPFQTGAEFPAYWAAATAAYGGEDLTLEIARELPVGSFGRTSYAIVSAPTIGDAFEIFRQEAQRALVGMTTHLDHLGKLAFLSLRGPAELGPLYEIQLAVLALRCQQLAMPPIEPTVVELARPEPRDVTPWKTLFGVVPTFGAASSSFAIPQRMLDRPLRTAEATVHKTLGTPASTAELVRAAMEAKIRETPTIGDVARTLGLSQRTLQRRLGDERVSFRDLLLDVRIATAQRMLERIDVNIGEIAAAVGFANVSTFSTAFSGKTGVTPTAFRKQRAAGRSVLRAATG